MSQEKFILAIDQGTTSSRAIVFNHDGQIVSSGQLEHEQIFPRAGWVEHDPMEIIRNTNEAVGQALTRADINRHQLEGVGITNQRETTVIWNKNTGKPVYNAIVWQDTRTQKICDELAGDDGPDKYKERVGLPLATYFAGPKAKWIFDNVDGVKESAEAGELLFGTMDTWVLWNLTGGVNGGIHVTDVTNASRTMLMNIKSLDWNEEIAGEMGIPLSMLPEIRSCSEVYGYGAKNGLIIDTPICGIVGDQQAATFGQACFEKGQAKNTYGTGNFMLINTGTEPVASKNGLLTTVAYKIGDADAVYALEGSVAVTGSLVQWLRDNFGIISEAPEVEKLAKNVDDNGGCYIVPAFSGLFAPHWESDARGVMVGLTRYVNKNHIARAALESVAFQSREVLDAMNLDSGVELTELKVDGGMVANETLMQFQADLLGVPVIRPEVVETTALGAAYAAGIAVKFWNGEEDVKANWREDKRWLPSMDEDKVARAYRLWNKAVERSKNWVDEDVEALSD
ncbi:MULTISPECIES: glycerol kinase GlpK [Brevibacterium]|uniref:Glycerol kinase n=3 Tax=Brevibacterium TaxID=1696 RepID=A0A2H1J180_9MICO|nr:MULTISPECIES: glycerol kinase GlpK [Brevibacterium]SMX81138.1 glycerol kinase [Brevibacterium antiquum CNRZ 918]SMX95590.1 glycerol kinase [Brevibacterium antiquum]HCG56363.1 glycerol kinase [Brevibacterium sp.]